MLILGIETSCDDTAIAVAKIEHDQVNVLSNLVSSQIGIHSPYGGGVANPAPRGHQKKPPTLFFLFLALAVVSNQKI